MIALILAVSVPKRSIRSYKVLTELVPIAVVMMQLIRQDRIELVHDLLTEVVPENNQLLVRIIITDVRTTTVLREQEKITKRQEREVILPGVEAITTLQTAVVVIARSIVAVEVINPLSIVAAVIAADQGGILRRAVVVNVEVTTSRIDKFYPLC